MAQLAWMKKNIFVGMTVSIFYEGTQFQGVVTEIDNRRAVDPHIEIESVEEEDAGNIYAFPMVGIAIGFSPEDQKAVLKKTQKAKDKAAKQADEDE